MKKILFIAMLALMALSCTEIKEDINRASSDDNNKEIEEQKEEEKEKEGEEDTPGGQEEPTPLADSLLSVSGYPDIDMNPVIYAPAEGGEITADIQTNIPDAGYLIQDCSWATVKDNGKSNTDSETFTLLRGFQLNANSDAMPRFASVLIVDNRHDPAVVLKRLVIMQCGTKLNVEFEDPMVKDLLAHSKIDRDDNGEISFEEAAASYSYYSTYPFLDAPLHDSDIKKFPELKYFGGLCHVSDLFRNCDRLKDVTLPDFCTIIPDCAFSVCKSLKKITIPESVRRIGRYAFAYSGIAKDIYIPAGCVVEEMAFEGCKETTEPEEPEDPYVVDSVLYVSTAAGRRIDFDSNPVIYAPSGEGEVVADIITDIPGAAYLIQDCSWAEVKDGGMVDDESHVFTLKRSFLLEANNDALPRFASVLIVDAGCEPATILRRFTIMQCGTKELVEFEDPAVKAALAHSKIDSNNDGEISFDEAVSSYDNTMSTGGGFGGGGGISFTFDEDGIMIMGFSPLAGTDIKKFPELKYFGGLCHVVQLFMNCKSLETVTLPGFCMTIPSYAFKGCSSLKTITIPESVASIANYAFAKSGLTGEIYVPSGCVVDETAFEGCSITVVR